MRSASRPGAVAFERERDVVGDGQRLEQREVLEHHADAEPPRARGIGDGDVRPSHWIVPASGFTAP
jgi:hypothetical protein